MSSNVIRKLIVLLFLAGAGVTGFYAFEADKEVDILCGLFKRGTTEAELNRIIGTASFLKVDETREDQRRVLDVYSQWNFGRNGCRVYVANGAVARNDTWNGFDRLVED